MNACICPDLATCKVLQAQCDALLGYPAPGKDIGRGRHVAANRSVTLTYVPPVVLLDGTCAYPVDAVNALVLTANETAQVGPVPVNLIPVAPAPIVTAAPPPVTPPATVNPSPGPAVVVPDPKPIKPSPLVKP